MEEMDTFDKLALRVGWVTVSVGAMAFIIVVMVFTLHLFGISKYEGVCRPCSNKGISTRLHYMTRPDKWECKECRKDCLGCRGKKTVWDSEKR